MSGKTSLGGLDCRFASAFAFKEGAVQELIGVL